MAGMKINRRRRRHNDRRNRVASGVDPGGITHDDLAEVVERVIDIRDEANTKIETMNERVDRVEAVVDDLHYLSLAMAKACERIRD